MTRTQWYRSIAVVVLWQEKAWQDDRKFTVEDIDETLMAAAALGFIWKGNMLLAAVPGLNIVEGIVVAGAVASLAIGGVKGVENYIDFMTEPSKMPERISFTGKTIYKHKIEEPLVAAANWYVDLIDEGWSATQKYFRENNRFLSGPALPF